LHFDPGTRRQFISTVHISGFHVKTRSPRQVQSPSLASVPFRMCASWWLSRSAARGRSRRRTYERRGGVAHYMSQVGAKIIYLRSREGARYRDRFLALVPDLAAANHAPPAVAYHVPGARVGATLFGNCCRRQRDKLVTTWIWRMNPWDGARWRGSQGRADVPTSPRD
jgi:hypothetical protein